MHVAHNTLDFGGQNFPKQVMESSSFVVKAFLKLFVCLYFQEMKKTSKASGLFELRHLVEQICFQANVVISEG